jgi:hypothetical protein
LVFLFSRFPIFFSWPAKDFLSPRPRLSSHFHRLATHLPSAKKRSRSPLFLLIFNLQPCLHLHSFPLSCKTKPGQPPPLPLICSSRCPLPWQQTKRTEAAVLPLTAVTTSSLRRTFPSSPYRWPPPIPRQPQLFFIFCNRPQAAPQAPPSGLAARNQPQQQRLPHRPTTVFPSVAAATHSRVSLGRSLPSIKKQRPATVPFFPQTEHGGSPNCLLLSLLQPVFSSAHRPATRSSSRSPNRRRYHQERRSQRRRPLHRTCRLLATDALTFDSVA